MAKRYQVIDWNRNKVIAESDTLHGAKCLATRNEYPVIQLGKIYWITPDIISEDGRLIARKAFDRATGNGFWY